MAVNQCHSSMVDDVSKQAELWVGCSVCTIKENEVTYSVKTLKHKCQGDLLFAKFKSKGTCWRPISDRPKYPRPSRYDVCRFFVEGFGCTVHGRKCTFARSPEEAFLWTFLKNHVVDHESFISLIRESKQHDPILEEISEKMLADWGGEFNELCRECFHQTPCRITPKDASHVCDMTLGHRWRPMMVHCLAQSEGKCDFTEIRPLPPVAGLQLCCRDTEYKHRGHNLLECQHAHSEVELAIWRQEASSGWNRRELLWLSQKRRQQQSMDGARPLAQSPTTKLDTFNDSHDRGIQGHVANDSSYQDGLLKEYRESDDQTVDIMAEHVDDVDITHDEDLYVECPEVGTQIKWSFQIKTERLLSHVALLKNEQGGVFSLGQSTHGATCTYAVGKSFVKSGLCYEFNVTFTSFRSGLYEQWVVFDFDTRPVLLQKIKVRVGELSDLKPGGAPETVAPVLERWHKGNRVIIPNFKSKSQEHLQEKYKLRQRKLYTSNTVESPHMVSRQNYRENMHRFLYTEEHVETDVISRLDFRGIITLSDSSASPYKEANVLTCPGELIGTLPFSYTTTQGTPEGVLLKREVETVLVGLVSPGDQRQTVYEALILQNLASETEMHLLLSRNCCSDLGLQKDQIYEVEVQFQLNRLSFWEMHKAIDLLPNLNNVLPEFTNCSVPSHSTKYPQLNGKQQAAMEFILGNVDGQNGVAPLLIYGPFGTGKTFTLASAAKEVVCQSDGRVLICTHTNSSADIYVNRHFHQYFEAGYREVRPLRIKTTGLNATDAITKKYCLLSPDGQCILFPRRCDLDSHRIVITTTSWAKNLHGLNLPKDYFSHIMIDEASQMLECEALMALGLAGPATRVILAGDHMQMGPKLFSVDDSKRSDHTLLNRLFYYYQSQEENVALDSRIIFNENYRSNEEIVKFVSTHFYTGKSVTIRACGDVPAHPKHYPLRFHHVRGECHLHPTHQSWYNFEETESVVKIVKDLLNQWPAKQWGAQKTDGICILSEGWQVQVIRDALWCKRLHGVVVQNLANVQGKQFRVIVMTTVQTRDQLLMSKTSLLEFFNDARVLNTAMTRAQSQVIVVGDAAALCYFGKCSKTWKCYIEHCMKKGGAQPEHLTEEFLRKEVEEIARFHRAELDVDAEEHPPPAGEDQGDQILQQMIKEYAAEHSEESDTESEIESNYASQQHTRRYRQTGLFLQTLSLGRTARYRKLSDHKSGNDKGIVGETFVCTLEDDFQHKTQYKERTFIQKTMEPLDSKAVKIRVLLAKRYGNWLPIWHPESEDIEHVHIDEEMRQKHVFIVQVICWKDNCLFPLGKVVDVLPIGTTMEEGLKVLDARFKRDQLPPHEFPHAEVDDRTIVDLRDLRTFTIDPWEAKRLDDAISIKELQDHYEVGVHITDVVGVLTNSDAHRHENKEAILWPPEEKSHFVSSRSHGTDRCSLSPGKDRIVISLITTVDKKTGLITKRTWQISRINSNRKLTYKEAEDILRKSSGNDLRFKTVEDCIAVAYHFSQARRKERLKDNWAYSQPRDHQTPGRRRSYLMVEELNIMFNHEMSKYLIDSTETKFCTPLRCQKSPEKEMLEKLKTRHQKSGLMQMSANLKSCFCSQLDQDLDQINLNYPEKELREKMMEMSANLKLHLFKPFTVLASVWSDIHQAASDGEYDKMADLIGTDDLYPQLLPVLTQFRGAQSKAYVIRSNSCADANVGHYSLAVESYTQASSPMRRSMDRVLQSLFHSVYSGRCIQYSPQDIDKLCKRFQREDQDTEEREEQEETIKISLSLRKRSMTKLACVVSVQQNKDHFKVSFPFNKGSLPERLPLLYRDLLLDDQPVFDRDDEHQSVKLNWRRRVYIFSASGVLAKQRKLVRNNPCIQVPQKLWHDIAVAVQHQDLTRAANLITSTSREKEPSGGSPESADGIPQTTDAGGESHSEHFTEHCLCLSQGDIVELQLTAELHKGSWVPRVQLLYVNRDFVVCVEHAHRPADCFTKQAERYTKDYYQDINEYVKVWKPLCRMVSASSAVGDSESITIEDVRIVWEKTRQGRLEGGSFSLPMESIKHWNIECNLAQCYLCIKKRNLMMKVTQSDETGDPPAFTWVAHGVVKGCEETGKKSKNKSKKVKFYINHTSMETVPDDVHKGADFSIEIIPKLPPDIRTENAINNTMNANALVQYIALGWQLKEDDFKRIPKWQIMKHDKPLDLPLLNDSQYNAVDHAVNSSFTIIQGPPGTGKTIVGAYIAFWFSKQLEPATDDKDRKEVVLYCGPSNKSVDVVAEYLQRFEDSLKPLRVYSRQTEMQEYPYPGSTLQVSRKSRQERSSPQLRSITLHHRIREDGNPHSQYIKSFDEKIKNGEISEPLSEEDEKQIEKYKEKLNEAREYELKRHDVILCTCTAASSANLTKAISAKLILIDECAMATEPQALIPLVSYKPQKIVLLGDHKQLRPIVKNERAKKMGMSRSLFERCMSSHTYEKAACTLNTQYRMHEDICEFPSYAYYKGKLQTKVECRESVLRINRHSMLRPTRIVFVDIEGREISQFVSTAKGNEKSVANHEESIKATEIAAGLVRQGCINQEDIAILSPYNAQVADIKKRLLKRGLPQITVNTITKSQGSEWRYVILSVVRSCPSKDIQERPARDWLSKHVGFVGDANQINVAITRAQDGLCILGNQKLLACSKAWNQLLQFYTKKNCVVNEQEVCVCRGRGRAGTIF
ncbi:hypothetical protein ACEWY4_012831 [Coilia grayii]|uniref:Helicase with zinc finger domain 2 n=1 Tax=Coilia grayii TaxID=363190 RepID=A0ABD1JUN4_9TELE